jgi:hypothetical protein
MEQSRPRHYSLLRRVSLLGRLWHLRGAWRIGQIIYVKESSAPLAPYPATASSATLGSRLGGVKTLPAANRGLHTFRIFGLSMGKKREPTSGLEPPTYPHYE